MISDYKQIMDLFEEINKKLTIKVNVYIIGGAALLLEGLKPATKDIDLIFENEKQYILFSKVLKSINFKEKIPSFEYKKMALSKIMERNDYRIDAFLKKVCKRFELSDDMIKRSDLVQKLKNIVVYKCSNEDIFLFKSMTERPGDLDDCIEMIKKGIDWNIIKNELINQIKINGEDVWITWVGERFDELIEKGITIPIIKEIDKLRDDYFNEIERKIKMK